MQWQALSLPNATLSDTVPLPSLPQRRTPYAQSKRISVRSAIIRGTGIWMRTTSRQTHQSMDDKSRLQESCQAALLFPIRHIPDTRDTKDAGWRRYHE